MNKAWGRPKNNQNKPNRSERRNPKALGLDPRSLDGAPGRPGTMTISIYYGTDVAPKAP